MDNSIATLAYADVFDYPLTKDELSRWLIRSTKPNISHLTQKDGYYFLNGRSGIVNQRKKKQVWQKKKMVIAHSTALLLSRIPTILLVGVTGGLAMNNANRQDDIDVCLIVKNNTLWTSRLLANSILDFSGLRRRPNEKQVANKICLNMFMTENGMRMPPTERDLFMAHEVLQMVPIFDRNHIYKRFLKANSWVKKFLPNAWRYCNVH